MKKRKKGRKKIDGDGMDGVNGEKEEIEEEKIRKNEIG